MFEVYRLINTKFSRAISRSSTKNLPSVSLVFFLTVILFVPRKAIKNPYEFDVLCEKKTPR